MVVQPIGRESVAQQFTKPALHPITDDRVADLLCDRDAITLAFAIIAPRQKNKADLRISQPLIGCEEICTLCKNLWHVPAHIREKAPAREPLLTRRPINSATATSLLAAMQEKLGGERLATTLATRAQNVATARGCLACKEAMATLAHKIARLESPLHIVLE